MMLRMKENKYLQSSFVSLLWFNTTSLTVCGSGGSTRGQRGLSCERGEMADGEWRMEVGWRCLISSSQLTPGPPCGAALAPTRRSLTRKLQQKHHLGKLYEEVKHPREIENVILRPLIEISHQWEKRQCYYGGGEPGLVTPVIPGILCKWYQQSSLTSSDPAGSVSDPNMQICSRVIRIGMGRNEEGFVLWCLGLAAAARLSGLMFDWPLSDWTLNMTESLRLWYSPSLTSPDPSTALCWHATSISGQTRPNNHKPDDD